MRKHIHMNKIGWLILACLLLLTLVSGCPRDDGETNVIETSNDPPAVSVLDDETADTNGDVNIDVTIEGDETTEVETTDGEGEDGETADGESADTADADGAAEAEAAADAEKDAGVVTVVLETTKGDVVLAVHPDWAPIGAAHFLELVRANYYNGAPWFRVIPGFVAQVGISPNSDLMARWGQKTIQDDPVVKSNSPGTVAFGKSGAPNSRSTHIFVNLVDNGPVLDGQGFAAFAEIVEGRSVVDSFHPITDEAGNRAFGNQGGIQAVLPLAGGMEQFKSAFPDADYITRAYIRTD